MTEARAGLLARITWVSLVVWQFAWLAVLPEPLGKRSIALAVALTVPLLLPVWGILKGQARGLIWGGYLAIFAGMIGIAEFWSAPSERPAAGLQLALCAGYLVFLALATRRRKA